MKRPILASLAIILGVALCWAAPPVDKLPSLLTTPAEARNISVIVGGSPPAAGTEGTAGYTGAQLGSIDEVNTDQSEGLVVTFANSGTVSKITAILNAPEGAINAKGCIWSSNGSSLLGCSNGVSIANTGAATYNFTLSPGVSVTATSYLIGIVSEGYTINIYYGSNTGDIIWEDNSNSYSSPQTVTREDNSDIRMNIYATYTY